MISRQYRQTTGRTFGWTTWLLASFVLLAAAQAHATQVRSLNVDGKSRTFRLFEPKGTVAGPLPLVIALHGAVQSAAEFEADLGMNRIAGREKFAVVYPQGINRLWEDGRPVMLSSEMLASPGHDISFLIALIRTLIAEGVAQPDRIYLVGLSMGGYMTGRMACEHPELFAAIAKIAANAPEKYRTACRHTRAMPALVMYGSYDPISPWFGLPIPGANLMTSAETAEYYAVMAGCMSHADRNLPSRTGTASVSIRRWSICRDSAGVELYGIKGGGHLPPSKQAGRGETFVSIFLQERSHVIDAAEEIWKFFRQFRRQAGVQRGSSAQ